MKIDSNLFMKMLDLHNGDKIVVDKQIYTVNNCILEGIGPLQGKHLMMLDGMEIDKVTEPTCLDYTCDECPIRHFDCMLVRNRDNMSLKEILTILLSDDEELLALALKRLERK